VHSWLRRGVISIAGALLIALTIWSLCFFDTSTPALPPRWAQRHEVISTALNRAIPAGLYLSSLIEGANHSAEGHDAYLLGRKSKTGWWDYFPIIATFKVPLGVALLLIIGFASFAWRGLR